jgi:hypothetical protein
MVLDFPQKCGPCSTLLCYGLGINPTIVMLRIVKYTIYTIYCGNVGLYK